jgi:hypothetical protein
LEEAMTNPLAGPARLLFRTALAIFVVTILIGILNGLDVFEPDHNLLLTHVHAGTLGWITLTVFAAAMLIFGEGIDPAGARSANTLAIASVAATVLYVAAFSIGTGIYRPITGTLMLIAIAWMLAWVIGRRRRTERTVARLGILLAMVALLVGAVLGVMLGVFVANGSLPGLSATAASSLAGAHPPAMLIGYLILAAAAVIEWRLGPQVSVSQARLGVTVMWLLFLAGMILNVGVATSSEVLPQVSGLFEVVAIIIILVRMRSQLSPSAWRGQGALNFARLSVVFLAVGIGLLIYLIQLFASGQLADPSAGGAATNVLVAFDHVIFIGVMTNLMFSIVAASREFDLWTRVVMWAVNLGVVGFAIGLVLDSEVVKRVSTPVMGLGLLLGIMLFMPDPLPEDGGALSRPGGTSAAAA